MASAPSSRLVPCCSISEVDAGVVPGTLRWHVGIASISDALSVHAYLTATVGFCGGIADTFGRVGFTQARRSRQACHRRPGPGQPFRRLRGRWCDIFGAITALSALVRRVAPPGTSIMGGGDGG